MQDAVSAIMHFAMAPHCILPIREAHIGLEKAHADSAQCLPPWICLPRKSLMAWHLWSF